MSLHQHVTHLNSSGSRLADLVSRLRFCADAASGSRPEPDRPYPAPPLSAPTLQAGNLNDKLSNVTNQYNEVIDQLAQQVERLEEQLLDHEAKVGAVAKGY